MGPDWPYRTQPWLGPRYSAALACLVAMAIGGSASAGVWDRFTKRVSPKRLTAVLQNPRVHRVVIEASIKRPGEDPSTLRFWRHALRHVLDLRLQPAKVAEIMAERLPKITIRTYAGGKEAHYSTITGPMWVDGQQAKAGSYLGFYLAVEALVRQVDQQLPVGVGIEISAPGEGSHRVRHLTPAAFSAWVAKLGGADYAPGGESAPRPISLRWPPGLGVGVEN